jgi:hypothetical protein
MLQANEITSVADSYATERAWNGNQPAEGQVDQRLRDGQRNRP